MTPDPTHVRALADYIVARGGPWMSAETLLREHLRAAGKEIP